MNQRPPRPGRLERGGQNRQAEPDCESWEIEIHVPADLRWFSGHFPGNPVLPAMVQLHEVLILARQTWPDLCAVRQVTRAKFQKPIRPLDSLILQLRRGTGSGKIAFRFVRGADVCSSGTLAFRMPNPDQP